MLAIAQKRQLLPATYNAARELERPIPLIAPIENNDETDENDDSISATTEHDASHEGSLQENDFDAVDNFPDADIKPTVDADDLAAFENLFGDDYQVPSGTVNDNDAFDSSENQDSTVSSSVFQESFLRSIRFESTRASAPPANNVEPNNQNNVRIDGTAAGDISEPNIVKNRSDKAANGDAMTSDDIGEPNSAQNESDNASNGDDTTSDDIGEKAEEESRKKQIEANLREVLLRGQTVVLGDDLEFISIPTQQLQAIQCKPEYRTKSNDVLCGNHPFKENVCLQI